MIVAIGSDHLGLELKNQLIEELSKRGHTFEDFGTFDKEPVDYPDIAHKVATSVAEGTFKRGILVCGTGIGMAITANKTKGVYAAVCHDIYSTERSILSNNANIMCLGALVVGLGTAVALADKWLGLEFKEGPSSRKLAKIKAFEAGSTGVS